MRRAFQLTFVWFFAVMAGFAWAGLDMGSQPSYLMDVQLVSAQ